MKVCRECGASKPLSEFYKHAAMMDGHLNKCIPCVLARVKKHREANLERVRGFDRQRGKQPHRVEARNLYAKTEAGKQARKKASSAYNKRHPMRYAAHIIAGNATRDGKLIPATECSVCKSTKKIEGHHDDYTKPLDVRWLCESCHKDWHRHHQPRYE
jgi:hypothetical protein